MRAPTTLRPSLLLWLLIPLFGTVSVFSDASADAPPDGPRTSPGGQRGWDATREAGHQNSQAAGAAAQPSLLAAWHDLSGNDWHVSQTQADQQPRLFPVVDDTNAHRTEWVVRFDGTNDHLISELTTRRLRDMTLFMVTAPHTNPGNFRGFLAFSANGQRDYESGFNLDMGPSPSTKLNVLNVEGRGCGGARDLMQHDHPFRTLRVFEVVCDSQAGKAGKVEVVVDGRSEGERECKTEDHDADRLVVGARLYSNDGGPQRAQGFLQGDIAEVLLYDRALSPKERAQLRDYLETRYDFLRNALPAAIERDEAASHVERLQIIENAPAVQMLVPGFSVHALPVELNNLNNLRYRPDGKLVALGYDGDIWLLSDTDGDGWEDSTKRVFHNQGSLRGPIGLAVLPFQHPLLRRGDQAADDRAWGVVVASKGKVSAILDHDGDDISDEERVIASGWQEITQNVDAVGVAIHPHDGAIYFALGTAAYNNAYLLNDRGTSDFDLNSERGTIQRIEPDLSRRSTVCTGVRFIIGMEFDENGELFVTDQEGATWLPNGNPFDELLHIRAGRHYGFPPRHPRHLPHVFDEPSLFDYGPQHQSTCGMTWNRSLLLDGPTFGPASWKGDLIVTGESRGKLYRTRVARRDDGEFMAINQLIGCLPMLTVDCTVSPRGDLLVACHSGGPDWGTGPTGKGKIFVIRYDQPSLPQPSHAYVASPSELRVVFDRPLEPSQLQKLAQLSEITFGQYVAAADRFETIRPGYAVTDLQQSQNRFRLPIHSAGITPDRTALILATDPINAPLHYALKLPGMGRPPSAEANGQHPDIDLAFTPTGWETRWYASESSSAEWHGWLPHPDASLSRQLLLSPRSVNELIGMCQTQGIVEFAAKLDLHGVFVPALQPLSQLDYDPSEDHWVTQRAIVLESDGPFELIASGQKQPAVEDDAGRYHAEVMLAADADRWLDLRITATITANSAPRFDIAWRVSLGDGQQRQGPLALHRFYLPWVDPSKHEAHGATERVVPELAGGDRQKGRELFLHQELGCAKCHSTRSVKGGLIGPDLSNLVHRDYASVFRDITQPSHAINPDYITYNLELHDGRVLTGTVRSEGASLHVGNNEGKEIVVQKSEVASLVAGPISTMPTGLFDKLSDEQRRDLLTFLMVSEPLAPVVVD